MMLRNKSVFFLPIMGPENGSSDRQSVLFLSRESDTNGRKEGPKCPFGFDNGTNNVVDVAQKQWAV